MCIGGTVTGNVRKDSIARGESVQNAHRYVCVQMQLSVQHTKWQGDQTVDTFASPRHTDVVRALKEAHTARLTRSEVCSFPGCTCVNARAHTGDTSTCFFVCFLTRSTSARRNRTQSQITVQKERHPRNKALIKRVGTGNPTQAGTG